ncbi:MAG: hypothetical protein ACK551_00320 [Vampirovibrionales bacterium]
MSTTAPINPLTSPNAKAISFNGIRFSDQGNQEVAAASKGSSSISLTASFTAGNIVFKNTANSQTDRQRLISFNKSFSVKSGDSFKDLFSDCNNHVGAWVQANRNVGYKAQAYGRFHRNSNTPSLIK